MTGEDMADMVETDTTTGALRLYTSLNVPATKGSGGDSKPFGSLMGREKGHLGMATQWAKLLQNAYIIYTCTA